MKKNRVEIALAVVLRDGGILVGRRAAGSHLAGYRELPGGKLRAGESPGHAAARELFEETGLRADGGELLRVQEYDYPGQPLRLHFVLCHPDPPGDLPLPPFEWLPLTRIDPDDFPPANRPFFLEDLPALLLRL